MSTSQRAIAERVAQAAEVVEQERFTLNATTFASIHALFVEIEELDNGAAALAALAPEYGRSEYFANALAHEFGGGVAPEASSIVATVEKAIAARPAFGQWFAVEEGPKGAFALPARWLCHLVGFRHRVIHIFCDPPTADGYTFVQLRSLSKPNAPACFDVPVGGHVSGLARLDATVEAEAAEELGLDAATDFSGIAALGSYDYVGKGTDQESVNVELRYVYRADLAPGASERVRFQDHEVAALCLFDLSALTALLRDQPERFASGIQESFALYRDVTPVAAAAMQGRP